jgi:hypothetical protein
MRRSSIRSPRRRWAGRPRSAGVDLLLQEERAVGDDAIARGHAGQDAHVALLLLPDLDGALLELPLDRKSVV